MVLALARLQRGVSLVELLVATAIGVALLAALSSVAREALQARAPLRDTAEALYQGRFALQRVSAAALVTAPKALTAAPANTSGDWFSPVYFCVNAALSLVETTSTDTTCSGTQVIAQRVSSFSVATPSTVGGLDGETAALAITLSGPSGGGSVSVSDRARLGGGAM